MNKKESEYYSACKWARREHKEGRYILKEEVLEIVTKFIEKYDKETDMNIRSDKPSFESSFGTSNRNRGLERGNVIGGFGHGSLSKDPIRRKGYRL